MLTFLLILLPPLSGMVVVVYSILTKNMILIIEELSKLMLFDPFITEAKIHRLGSLTFRVK